MNKVNLIDIGCNLASPRLLKHVERILDDAEQVGVRRQILTGSDTKSNDASLKLAIKYPQLYSTVGFHPHHANDWQPKSDPLLHVFSAQHPRVVAVGEMGLDYFRNLARHDNQRKCFEDQLNIAVQVQKPVFLHERHAFEDFRTIMQNCLSELNGAVWHCFTGNGEQLDWALAHGLSIGITGWIADPERGKIQRDIVKNIPNDKIMIETDAPYLTPKTLSPKPKVNEPQYLPEVLRVLAECRQQDYQELAVLTTENAERFFHLNGN